MKKKIRYYFCPSSFAFKSNMKSHVESAHGGRKSICEICLSSFMQKSSLKEHVESIHTGKKHPM